MTTPSPAFTFTGAAGSLLKRSVAASATVTATLDDLSGVTSVEWSIVSTDETSSPEVYIITPSGPKGSIATLTALGAGTAALLQCKINGGIDPRTGNQSDTMKARAKFYVATAGGLEVGAYDEKFESDPAFGTTAIQNGAIRNPGGQVPITRQVIAGAGLTGGGALSSDVTLNVIANADGSITVNANDIQVGVLATDGQHGVRGGGTQHAAATTSVAGFMSAADKVIVNNAFKQGGNAFGALAQVGSTDAFDTVILAGGSQILRCFQGGEVGINVGTPLARFNVNTGDGALELYAAHFYGASNATGAANYVRMTLANDGASNTRARFFIGGNVAAEQWTIETDSAGNGTRDFSIVDLNGSNTRFYINGSGFIGIGTTSPGAILHVDSNAANTVAILRLENTAGDINVFRTDATPEAAVTGSIGDIAVDSTNGAVYLKETGSATNTGWKRIPPHGGLWTEVSTKTGAYTAAWGEIVPYDPTGGGFTITLPTAVGNSGRSLILVNVSGSTNTVTADGNASETINGSATFAMSTARQSTTFTALAGNVVIT